MGAARRTWESRSETRSEISRSSPMGDGILQSQSSVSVRLMSSNRDVEVAQCGIQAGFLVGALFALTDDQRAPDLILACREFLGAHAGNDDAARWHSAAI